MAGETKIVDSAAAIALAVRAFEQGFRDGADPLRARGRHTVDASMHVHYRAGYELGKLHARTESELYKNELEAGGLLAICVCPIPRTTCPRRCDHPECGACRQARAPGAPGTPRLSGDALADRVGARVAGLTPLEMESTEDFQRRMGRVAIDELARTDLAVRR